MVSDDAFMRSAMRRAETVRGLTAPNPWVGAVVVTRDGNAYPGATQTGGGRHAEDVALELAGDAARGATLYVTLEPCAHIGKNPACVAAIADAGITRVVVGIVDPDERVRGRGIDALRALGIEVTVGILESAISMQLLPYLTHRRTGRPFVVLKLAATLDGRIAAPDGTSRWVTGELARRDVHRLRSRCDAIVVGAGTIRTDDPALTVRLGDDQAPHRQPRRVVLGTVPPDARAQPLLTWTDSPEALLRHLAQLGDLQVLVEGGAHVAASFHRAGLVDRYVLYVAPAILGGADGVPMFAGVSAPTMQDVWRGELLDVVQLGQDVKIVVGPKQESA